MSEIESVRSQNNKKLFSPIIIIPDSGDLVFIVKALKTSYLFCSWF